jgi:serine/threonine-protein kinase
MSAAGGARDLLGAFIAVREAPEAEREAVIAAHCAGDAAFEHELRTLLTDDARANRRALHAGKHLQGGRYHLRQELGRGGSASVWLAHDQKLGREIALKILERWPSDAGFEDALREARAASPIVDDHVCRVLDVDICPDQAAAYIAMESCRELRGGRWLEASSLRQSVPRSRREAVRWAAQVARGIDAAHQQGVFHGDLKPENVVIRPVSRRAQVIDFGLARHFVAGRGTFEPRGQGVLIAGTPAYMAPEQALGLPKSLDPEVPEDHQLLCRVDIYALGALLYELLAGRAPLKGWRRRPC